MHCALRVRVLVIYDLGFEMTELLFRCRWTTNTSCELETSCAHTYIEEETRELIAHALCVSDVQ